MPKASRQRTVNQSPHVRTLSQTESQEMRALAKTCQPAMDKIAEVFGSDTATDLASGYTDGVILPMDEQFDHLQDPVDRNTQTPEPPHHTRNPRLCKRYLDYMETTMDTVQVPKGVKDESLRWSKRYLSTIPEDVLADENVMSLVEHITSRVVDAISKSTLMSTVSAVFNQIGGLVTQVNNLSVAQDHSAKLINTMSENLQQIDKRTNDISCCKEDPQLYEIFGAVKFYARSNETPIDESKLWQSIKDKAPALLALPANKINTAVKVLYKSVVK
ncbi:MAG: phosphoprotein [Wenzhou bat rhabdovirus 1]|nr:MAG: phosphoprotein [Wenzhou bat rhabdovirus 1]WPV62698.1 MAG: phosphoprotein [Wenzhou bat rhabdovirus 1]WPV62704.1 MAG: phosphoprotein [Wenzhou bat rhabdovirus 1]